MMKTHARRCALLSLCAVYITFLEIVDAATSSNASPLTVQDPGHIYPVTIGAEDHIVQGRISSEAKPGTLIPSNVIMEGEEDADIRVRLRVEIRDSEYKRPHVYHPDIVINQTDPLNPQFEHPVIKFPNSSLPYGMEFVVVHTNAFYVTADRYIAVNDFSELGGDSRIHFDVLLKDRLSETPYVSNSLPFVVTIEYPRVEANPNAALFAGVLILTILVISLVIPFGVRAKRRQKAGKPICGCGSAEDASDTGSLGSHPEFMKNRAMSIGGKDNLAMILDHAKQLSSRPSEHDLRQTIQNRMLRSESFLHFQPQWLDPHLSDYYHRPDFSYLEQLHQQQQQQQQHQNHQQNYQRHHNGVAAKPSMTGASNHPPASQGKSATTSASLAPPQPNGHYANLNGGFGNPMIHSPNTNRFSNDNLHSQDLLSLINANRRNSIGAQLYHPMMGQAFGGSTSSINHLSNGTNTPNGLAFFRAPRGTNSNRSSCNSLYTYPTNFNQGIEIPMNKLGGGKRKDGGSDEGASTAVPLSDSGQSGVAVTFSTSASNGDLKSKIASKDNSVSSDSGNASPSTSGVSNPVFQPDEPRTATDKIEIEEESERL